MLLKKKWRNLVVVIIHVENIQIKMVIPLIIRINLIIILNIISNYLGAIVGA